MTLGLRHYLESRISPEPNSGCWLWEGGLSSKGYAVLDLDGFSSYAHRTIYKILKGVIPKGLELDHTCRMHCCVNPDHLEPVTHLINVRRGTAGIKMAARRNTITHCVKGHEFTEENTVWRNNYRRCRTCKRANNSAHNRKRRNK